MKFVQVLEISVANYVGHAARNWTKHLATSLDASLVIFASVCKVCVTRVCKGSLSYVWCLGIHSSGMGGPDR